MAVALSLALLGAAFLLALISTRQLATQRPEELERRVAQIGAGTGILIDGRLRVRRPSRPFSRLASLVAIVVPASLQGSKLRMQLASAGIYGNEAVRSFVGANVLLAGLLAAAAYGAAAMAHRPDAQQTLVGLGGGLVGFHLPGLWLRFRIRNRQEAIRLSLPDALDLLVVCVEAGLGLNAAIVRVSEELHWSAPELAQEFRVVNQEIRAGATRIEGLRSFSQRVPIPDVKSLVAMFVQTDRLGTSIARSLRVHAESLRTKRRQRAEEKARKAAIKLVFPLVFFIFPQLFIVILGPAGIRIVDVLKNIAIGGH